MTNSTYSSYSSYNSSPRSPVPVVTLDPASPSEHSDGSNSPSNHGRRLRVQELLTGDSNSPLQKQQHTFPQPTAFPPITVQPAPTHFLNPSRYVTHLTIPDSSIHKLGQLLTPNTSPNSAITQNQPHMLHHYTNSPTLSSSGGFDDPNDPLMPLTLQERRERNKVASAKYRAKKHKQTQEMGSQIQELNSRISALTAENGLLGRQVQELKGENVELKSLVDDLRSQLVEDKVLKRLGRSGSKGTIKVNNASLSAKRERTKHGNSGHAKGTLTTSS